MLKKFTSVLLAISFFVLAISGTIMLFSKKLASGLRLDPFHELFALIMVITGIIHFILNFKLLISYLKIIRIKILFTSVVGIIIIMYIIIMNMDLPEKHGPHGNNPGTYTEEHD